MGTSVPYLVLALAQNHSRCLSFRGRLTRTHNIPPCWQPLVSPLPGRPSEAASMPSTLDTHANVVLLVSTWSPLEGAPPEDREVSPQPLGLCACVCVCVTAAQPDPDYTPPPWRTCPLASPVSMASPGCRCPFVFLDVIYNNRNSGVFGANLSSPCIPISDVTLDSWR